MKDFLLENSLMQKSMHRNPQKQAWVGTHLMHKEAGLPMSLMLLASRALGRVWEGARPSSLAVATISTSQQAMCAQETLLTVPGFESQLSC